MISEAAVVLSLVISGTSAWVKYQPKTTNPYPEYYAYVQEVDEDQTYEFTQEYLANNICTYTDREVFAYYEEGKSSPTKYKIHASKNQPIIKSITGLTNDLGHVIQGLMFLEDKAVTFGYNDMKDMTNLVLGYLRSLNIAYSESGETYHAAAWKMLAGRQEPVKGFFDYVDSKYQYHDSYKDFFVRFLDNGKYNSIDHGTCSVAGYGWPDGTRTMVDPLSEGRIDLIHMFASIDGEIDYTDFKSDYSLNLAKCHMEKDLAGWGGDLQTVTEDKNYTEHLTKTSFSEVMSSSENFSQEDLLADIDAFNIASLCYSFLDLSSAVDFYYGYLMEGYTNRYAMFAESMTTETRFKWDCSLGEKVIRQSHAIMGLKWTPTGYEDIYGIDLVYQLMNKKNASYELRCKLADLFSSYILEKGEISA